jgi:hypothetical protein
MDAVEDGDMGAVRAIMTPHCQQNEEDFGWLKSPPDVTSYVIAHSEPESPANNAAGDEFVASVRVDVSYSVASGEPPYSGRYDDLLLAQRDDGTWWLAERGGLGDG